MLETLLATYAGIGRDNIGLAVYDVEGTYVAYIDAEDVPAEEGAGFGALTGAGLGLVAITVPGIGPIIAAGPLAALLGAAAGGGIGIAAGAVTGGITAALLDMGVPETDIHYYAESLRRGDALVVVVAEEDDAALVEEIMRQHGALDMEKRLARWRSEGWEGFDPTATPYSADELAQHRGYDDDDFYLDDDHLDVDDDEDYDDYEDEYDHPNPTVRRY